MVFILSILVILSKRRANRFASYTEPRTAVVRARNRAGWSAARLAYMASATLRLTRRASLALAKGRGRIETSSDALVHGADPAAR